MVMIVFIFSNYNSQLLNLDGDDVWLDALDQGEGRCSHCEAVLKLGSNLQIIYDVIILNM